MPKTLFSFHSIFSILKFEIFVKTNTLQCHINFIQKAIDNRTQVFRNFLIRKTTQEQKVLGSFFSVNNGAWDTNTMPWSIGTLTGLWSIHNSPVLKVLDQLFRAPAFAFFIAMVNGIIHKFTGKNIIKGIGDKWYACTALHLCSVIQHIFLRALIGIFQKYRSRKMTANQRIDRRGRFSRPVKSGKHLAAQGILTYCTNRTLPYLCTPTGSIGLSLVLLCPLSYFIL